MGFLLMNLHSALIQMKGLVEPLREPPNHRYMGLRQAGKGVERSSEAMMKITDSIDANTKSMDNLITAIGRKGFT